MLDRGRAAQAAALAVVLATGACGGDDDTVRDAAIDDPDSGTTLVVGTFNAGLARGLLVDSSGHPVLIDHVLVKGWPEAEAKGDQFLRGALTLRIQRQEIETAYSDHYGVRLTLTY